MILGRARNRREGPSTALLLLLSFSALLTPILIVLPISPVVYATTPTQSVECSGMGTTVTCAFTDSITSGDILVVGIATSSATISNVTDTRSTAYQQYTTECDASNNCAYAFAYTASSSGTDTVSVTVSTPSSISIFLYELSSFVLNGIQFNGATGTSTTTSCTSVLPTANMFVIGIVAAISSPMSAYTAGLGFTSLGLATYGASEYMPAVPDHDTTLTTDQVRGTQTGASTWAEVCLDVPISYPTSFNIYNIQQTNTRAATQNAMTRKMFWADAQWWLFMVTSAGLQHTASNMFSYGWTTLRTDRVANGAVGEDFAIWNNATTVCYSYAFSTNGFYFRCGTLGSEGSVAWRGSETVHKTGTFTYNFPSMTVDTSKNIWVAVEVGDTHGYKNVEIWEYRYHGSWALSYDYNTSETRSDWTGDIFAYSGPGAGDVGIVLGQIFGGSGSAFLLDRTGGAWQSVVRTDHVEPTRASVVTIGDIAYFGGAASTGAQEIAFFSHTDGNTTSPVWQNFTLSGALSAIPDYPKDLEGGITTNGVQNLVIFFSNSEEQSTTTQVYYISSSNLGSTWSNVGVVAGNENDVYGNPTLISATLMNATGVGIAWISNLANVVGNPSSATFQVRGAWYSLTPVKQPIELTVNEAAAPAQRFTIIGCSSSPTTLEGDGTVQSIMMNPNCSFTVVGSTSGGARWGYISSGRFSTSSVSKNSCNTDTCTEINLTYDYQLQLMVSGGHSIIPSRVSETSDGWYKYGDTLTVSSASIWGRSEGTGTRLSSWNLDGGSSISIAKLVTFTTSTITMTAAQAVGFNSIHQDQITLTNSPSSGGASAVTTSPSIPGDGSWYDAGTSVQIAATAASGYYFVSWVGTGSGSFSGSTNPTTITVNAVIEETATFAALTTTSATTPTPNTSSTTQPTTSSSIASSGGGSGIPESPVQLGIALLVTVVIVTSYVLARRARRIAKQPPI